MARIKRVFQNKDEVCHIWAQQCQDEGRNGTNNISFQGNRLISYGCYPIAEIYGSDKEKNGKLVLLNSESYSATTGQQISAARSAASHLDCLYVPCPAIEKYSAKEQHRVNISHFFKTAEGLADKIKTARKSDYRGSVRGALENVVRYCSYFKVRSLLTRKEKALLALVDSPQLWEHYGVDVAAFEDRYERATRLDRERAEQNRLAMLARAKEQAEKDAEAIAEWKDGKRSHLPGWHYPHEYLRVSGEHVETSKNVKVRLKECELLWRRLVRNETLPATVARYYQTRPDSWNGCELSIGCHRVPLSEMVAIAERMGWEGVAQMKEQCQACEESEKVSEKVSEEKTAAA